MTGRKVSKTVGKQIFLCIQFLIPVLSLGINFKNSYNWDTQKRDFRRRKWDDKLFTIDYLMDFLQEELKLDNFFRANRSCH